MRWCAKGPIGMNTLKNVWPNDKMNSRHYSEYVYNSEQFKWIPTDCYFGLCGSYDSYDMSHKNDDADPGFLEPMNHGDPPLESDNESLLEVVRYTVKDLYLVTRWN